MRPLCRSLAACLSVPLFVAAFSVAAHADNELVAITITDKGCEPNAVSVAPGKTTFKIKNASKRAIEWEILQGYMVVEERENIIPGFVQNLTATLEAGDYGMTCGLLSNPKGALKVEAAAVPAKP